MEPAQLLEGVEAVVHLAAQAGVRRSWGANFTIYTQNNMLTTQRLLEAGKEMGLGRLVYASSSSVYGDTKDLPMRETSACWPVSPYGVTKLAAEHLCGLYHKNFGMDTTSLRYFTVYGPPPAAGHGPFTALSGPSWRAASSACSATEANPGTSPLWTTWLPPPWPR